MITPDEAATFERCIGMGGICVFPADTVYGLACDPESGAAVERLYALKGRPPDKPAAVMFFDRGAALAALGDVGERTLTAAEALLPGPVTLLVANPGGRFPLACGPDPETLGLRCPALPPSAAALAAVRCAVMQSSANESGGADARRVTDVPAAIRDAADLVLDAGELPGVASTVIDLRRFELAGAWSILREGALSRAGVEAALGVA